MTNRQTQFNSGFTLAEVLVALAITMGAVMVITATSSGNLLRIRKSQLATNVATLLEKKTAEIEIKYRTKSLEEIPDEEKGDFGSNYKQYRWEFKSQEFEMPDLSPILLRQDGGTNDLMLTMVKQMQEYLSKAIKEAKVSVFVKTGKKETEYFVTTYFVDYSKDVPFAGIPAAPEPAGGAPATGSPNPSPGTGP